MNRFFSTPKRTVISTACIAVVIIAIASLISTALTKNSHVGGINASAETSQGGSKDGYIGSDHAKTIALEHAGLAGNDVRLLRAGLEMDDGIMVYDVSFRSGRTEYEYSIDAVTGEIIEFDIDRD